MTFLDRIRRSTLARVRGLVLPRTAAEPAAELSFRDALLSAPVGVVCEFKRKSPTAARLAGTGDPVRTLGPAAAAGAAAFSVLVEPEFFAGSVEDLRRVACELPLPVLFKDFVLDPVQVRLARRVGARAVLLVLRLLDDRRLRLLLEVARDEGIDALCEAHDEVELRRALEAGATLLGANQRDLDALEIRPGLAERLLARVPPGVARVAESGFSDPDSCARALETADAVLVGSALYRDGRDPGSFVREVRRCASRSAG